MELKTFQKAGIAIFGIVAVASSFIVSFNTAQKKIEVPPPIVAEEKKSDFFPEAYAVVLKHEGGYTNDPVDKGGATAYGVSLAFMKAQNIDIDGDGDVDVDDVKALKNNHAENIYRTFFWNKNRYNEIDNKAVAIKLFDTAVNTGASRCHKILRNTLNKIIVGKVDVNGIMDDEVMEIINIIEPKMLLEEFRNQQAAFYQALVVKTPKYKKYINGWLQRAKS